MNKSLMTLAIVFVGGVPSHGDDFSTLKTVLKSASPQEKIEAIMGSQQYLPKSRTHEGVKLLFDVGVNEDEDLGVRFAAIGTLAFVHVVKNDPKLILGTLEPQFEVTYKDAKSDDLSRLVAVVFFHLSPLTFADVMNYQVEFESPPWLSSGDPMHQLPAVSQSLADGKYRVVFPTLLKWLDGDRFTSLFAVHALANVEDELARRRATLGNATKLPPWFDLPAPILVKQLRIWRESDDHVLIRKALDATHPVTDPVANLVDLLGTKYDQSMPEARDRAIVTALTEVLKDDSVSEKARRLPNFTPEMVFGKTKNLCKVD